MLSIPSASPSHKATPESVWDHSGQGRGHGARDNFSPFPQATELVDGYIFDLAFPVSKLYKSNINEIKRRLLLGRKVMTNLDSILRSRDITLPTKVRLVKAMVYPVVMYGCESWTVKKAER